MNGIKILISSLAFLFAVAAQAEIKYVDDVMSKATPKETQDLAKLLQQIQMVPLKGLKEGKQVMKVTRVEKGSVWDREGIKVGDLVASGHSNQRGKTMELRNHLKKTTPAEGTQN